MRLIKPPPQAPIEVELTCGGCQAVLGVTVPDAVTRIYLPDGTWLVFRCILCERQVNVPLSCFEAPTEAAG